MCTGMRLYEAMVSSRLLPAENTNTVNEHQLGLCYQSLSKARELQCVDCPCSTKMPLRSSICRAPNIDKCTWCCGVPCWHWKVGVRCWALLCTLEGLHAMPTSSSMSSRELMCGKRCCAFSTYSPCGCQTRAPSTPAHVFLQTGVP